jgi:hypothetical protein
MAAFTAADGTYSWIVEPGTYTFEANRDGYASARGEVTVAAGEQIELDLTMAPNQ